MKYYSHYEKFSIDSHIDTPPFDKLSRTTFVCDTYEVFECLHAIKVANDAYESSPVNDSNSRPTTNWFPNDALLHVSTSHISITLIEIITSKNTCF